MFQINVHSNLREFERTVTAAAYKQIPFATAQALTSVARSIAAAEKVNEQKVLDRPKPFTQNAVGVIGASKSRLTAIVFMKDLTARYLEPYEFGGKNVLNSRAVLTPIAAYKDLDQFGNLPRNFVKSLRGRADIFIGPVQSKAGVINGIWQRSVEADAAVPVARMTKRGVIRTTKTRRGLNTSGSLRLLVRFTDAHAVRQHLGWFDVAKGVVAREFEGAMSAAIARALATAK